MFFFFFFVNSNVLLALQEAGLVPTLLPMLNDTDPVHMPLVTTSMQILEAFMEFSAPPAGLFRDMGGLGMAVDRMSLEVQRVIRSVVKKAKGESEAGRVDGSVDAAGGGTKGEGGERSNGEELRAEGVAVTGPSEAAAAAGAAALPSSSSPTAAPVSSPPSSSPGGGYQHSCTHAQRSLIKSLLRIISVVTFSPGSNVRLSAFSVPPGSQSVGSDGVPVWPKGPAGLPFCLAAMFNHAREFGGGAFEVAAAIMSDHLHHEPQCYAVMENAGLPKAFVDAVNLGELSWS